MIDCFCCIIESITDTVPVIGYSPLNRNLSACRNSSTFRKKQKRHRLLRVDVFFSGMLPDIFGFVGSKFGGIKKLCQTDAEAVT